MVGRDRYTGWQTNAACDAGFLADLGFPCLLTDPDDLGPRPLRWTEADAFEMTALRLASVLEHDGDAHAEKIARSLFKHAMREREI